MSSGDLRHLVLVLGERHVAGVAGGCAAGAGVVEVAARVGVLAGAGLWEAVPAWRAVCGDPPVTVGVAMVGARVMVRALDATICAVWVTAVVACWEVWAAAWVTGAAACCTVWVAACVTGAAVWATGRTAPGHSSWAPRVLPASRTPPAERCTGRTRRRR